MSPNEPQEVHGKQPIPTILCWKISHFQLPEYIVESAPETIVESGGSLYASLNATLITYVLIGVAGLAVLGYALYTLSSADGGLPFSSKQSYYDPTSDVNADAALEYAADDLQYASESHEYRRRRSAYEQSKFYVQSIKHLHMYVHNCLYLAPSWILSW